MIVEIFVPSFVFGFGFGIVTAFAVLYWYITLTRDDEDIGP